MLVPDQDAGCTAEQITLFSLPMRVIYVLLPVRVT